MKDAAKVERLYKGLAVSRGVGVGRIVFHGGPNVSGGSDGEKGISSIDSEISRFRSAVDKSAEQLRSLISANGNGSAPLADILTVQLLILEQSSFVENVESEIGSNGLNAEVAIAKVSERSSQKQALAADPHLREKRLDIEDVSKRLLGVLNGTNLGSGGKYSGSIVAAHELKPSEVIEISRHNPAGIITERGGWTSHSSILAREFMIPMVSGLRDLRHFLHDNDHAVVNGETGEVVVNPSSRTVNNYAGTARSAHVQSNDEDAVSETRTRDGVRVVIRANVDIPEAYQLARQKGAEGIGLFRSESLIPRPGSIPNEQEQLSAYREIGTAAGDQGVIIRTFDIGHDRLYAAGRTSEVNPSLGLRSIRLSLRHPGLFQQQIRAILQASADHKIDIVLPMIAGLSEVREASEIIKAERDDLIRTSVNCGDPRIGAMIEVPSGVFTAEDIAAEVDFLALGTNDLVQYLLAVDRDNDAVAEWYETLHPAVIKAIITVVSAAESNKIPILICGEMAGSPFYVPLLLAAGARELSMNINSISNIRRLISGITLMNSSDLLDVVDRCRTAKEVEDSLRQFYRSYWPDLFSPEFLAAHHG